MAKKFNILFLVLALGMFIVPSQSFFAQTLDTCCTEFSTMACCEKNQKKEDSSNHTPCDSDHSGSNSCNDCSTCNICHHTIVPFSISFNNWELGILNNISSNKEFDYLSPEISSIFSKIWQPPKIG